MFFLTTNLYIKTKNNSNLATLHRTKGYAKINDMSTKDSNLIVRDNIIAQTNWTKMILTILLCFIGR